jgi:transmembrane sensor
LTAVTPTGDLNAARNYLRLTDPDATHEEIVSALDWIERDTGHSDALKSIYRFMADCDDIAATLPEGEIIAAVAATTPGLLERWRRLLPTVASMSLAVAGVVAILMSAFSWKGVSIEHEPSYYATATGEVRTVHFADNVSVTLGGASAISVDDPEAVRRLVLADGQALIRISGSIRQPLIIETGHAILYASGAEVGVDREMSETTMTLVHGKAYVGYSGRAGQSHAMLYRGMQLTVFGDGRVSPISQVNPEQATSWKDGILTFVARPLELVVADLNRYQTPPIILEDRSIADKQISGLVRLDRIPEWLRGLAETKDIDVIFGQDGQARLRAVPRPDLLAVSFFRRPTTAS